MAKKPNYAKLNVTSPINKSKGVTVTTTNPFKHSKLKQDNIFASTQISQTSSIQFGSTSLKQNQYISDASTRYTALSYKRLSDNIEELIEVIAKSLGKPLFDTQPVHEKIYLDFTGAYFDEQPTEDFFSRIVLFNRIVEDSVSNSDFEYRVFNKGLFDYPEPLDNTALDLDKPLAPDYAYPLDRPYLHPNKAREDFITNITDDSIFTLHKQIFDYANPVDLVAVPDGSTYQLIKTIRNTIEPFDTFNKSVEYIRAFDNVVDNVYDDFYKQTDFVRTIPEVVEFSDDDIFTLDKVLTETPIVTEFKVYVLEKPLTDTVTANERKYINFVKPESDSVLSSDDFARVVEYIRSEQDSVSTSDSILFTNVKEFFETLYASEQKYLDLTKPLTDNSTPQDRPYLNSQLDKADSVGNQEMVYLGIGKFFEDYANPQDLLEVPDGSSFVLSLFKPNFVSTSDEFTRLVFYSRDIDDQVLHEELYTSHLTKPFSDSVIAVDDVVTAFSVKSIQDTVVSDDYGNLIMQSYMDSNTYFAEDYIGTYKTFT